MNGSTARLNEVNLGCLPFPTDERTNNNHSYYKIYFVLLSVHTAIAVAEKACKYGGYLVYEKRNKGKFDYNSNLQLHNIKDTTYFSFQAVIM